MKELLIREDCNVVIVNWLAGAGPPYTQAVANTRLVGAMTARLAYQLIEVGGIPSSRMHCIGHSLGAHTCGYVGYTLSNQYDYKLGRITGITNWIIDNRIVEREARERNAFVLYIRSSPLSIVFELSDNSIK